MQKDAAQALLHVWCWGPSLLPWGNSREESVLLQLQVRQVLLHPVSLGVYAHLPPSPGDQAVGEKNNVEAGISQGIRVPVLGPAGSTLGVPVHALPHPGQPWTPLGCCPGWCTLDPGNVAYLHHGWHGAAAADHVGRVDHAAWNAM